MPDTSSAVHPLDITPKFSYSYVSHRQSSRLIAFELSHVNEIENKNKNQILIEKDDLLVAAIWNIE